MGQVVRGEDFFDRAEIVEAIWSWLPEESVELVAPRRFGKSSVMRRLADDPQKGCKVAYLDCQAFKDPETFVVALHDVISSLSIQGRTARAAGRVGGAVGTLLGRVRRLKLPWIMIDLSDPKSPTWAQAIGRIQDAVKLAGCDTVVILDEFSMMLGNMRRAGVSDAVAENVLEWLRRLRLEQGRPKLAFVIGGSMSLEYWLRKLNLSGLMTDVRRVFLGPFDEGTAAELVRGLLDAEGLEYSDDVVSAVLEMITPPVPFWLQALIWFLSQDPGSSRRVERGDVVRAYHRDLMGIAGRHYFQPFVERFDRDAPEIATGVRALLSQLARSGGEGLTRDEMAAIFTGYASVDGTGFDAVFADLQSDFYVAADETGARYVFAHRVLRDWWLRWHPAGGRAR